MNCCWVTMVLFLIVILTVLVGALSYLQYLNCVRKSKLGWMPGEPGFPLIGIISELKKNTGRWVITWLIRECCGSCAKRDILLRFQLSQMTVRICFTHLSNTTGGNDLWELTRVSGEGRMRVLCANFTIEVMKKREKSENLAPSPFSKWEVYSGFLHYIMREDLCLRVVWYQ